MGCIICGKEMPAWFEGDMCSAKCRKKKSRDKLMASQRSHKIAFEIDAIARTIRLSKIDKSEAREMLYTIWDRVSELNKQISEMPETSEAKS